MDDFSFELKRQAIHMTGGAVIAVLTYLFKPIIGLWTAIPIIAGIVFFSILPTLGRHLHIHKHLIERYERSADLEKMPYKGAITYGLGIVPAIILLDTNMACAVIIILSLGDGLSTIVGKRIGRTPVDFKTDSLSNIKIFSKIRRTSKGQKTLEGFIGFMLGGFLGALVFTGPPQALFLASIGALVELLLPLDDNISIPC